MSVGAVTCILRDAGSLACLGNDLQGALGLGYFDIIGDDDNELGDALGPVALGAPALAIGAGDSVCALLSTRQIKCWVGTPVEISGRALGVGR